MNKFEITLSFPKIYNSSKELINPYDHFTVSFIKMLSDNGINYKQIKSDIIIENIDFLYLRLIITDRFSFIQREEFTESKEIIKQDFSVVFTPNFTYCDYMIKK